jgi:dihydropteroate synthase
MKSYQLRCGERILTMGNTPLMMGILNVTPDSFSDGGEFMEASAAVERGLQMEAEGADIIDVGGESTRPGSEAISAQEQIKRVCPVIWALSRQAETPISIDTTSSEAAAAALEAGATIINDISALRFDEAMAGLAAREKAPVILMHMQGTPRDMQNYPTYNDVVQEVKEFLAARIEYALSAGIEREQIIVDPGIGFGKSLGHNLSMLKQLSVLHELGAPVLVGPSRKSFIGKVLDIESPADREYGTAAAVAACVAAGVQILRVHAVKAMRQSAYLAAAIRSAK